MKKVVSWICEICYEKYNNEDDCRACEDKGLAVIPDWLSKTDKIYGFGEQGVVGPNPFSLQVDILGSRCSKFYNLGHPGDIRVMARGLRISHNFENAWVPLDAINPLIGWDFMRYVSHHPDDILKEANLWLQACRDYGIAPDITKASWGREIDDYKAAQDLRMYLVTSQLLPFIG